MEHPYIEEINVKIPVCYFIDSSAPFIQLFRSIRNFFDFRKSKSIANLWRRPAVVISSFYNDKTNRFSRNSRWISADILRLDDRQVINTVIEGATKKIGKAGLNFTDWIESISIHISRDRIT